MIVFVVWSKSGIWKGEDIFPGGSAESKQDRMMPRVH